MLKYLPSSEATSVWSVLFRKSRNKTALLDWPDSRPL